TETGIRNPFPTPSGQAGLDIEGDTRACATDTGRFEVRQLDYGSGNAIDAFWAVFEQYCNGASAKLSGEIRINANAVDVTVTKAGTGNGTIVSSPSGISCGTDCTEGYLAGTSVTLTPQAARGSIFTGW